MALLFIESFDHCNISTLGNEWGSTTLFIDPSTSYGRFGSKGCLFGGGRPLNLFSDKIGTQSTVIIGFAVYFTSYVAGMMNTYDATGADYQTSIYLNGDGALYAFRGNAGSPYNTVLGSSAPSTIVLNRWYYLETKITISNTVGVVQIKLDGTTVLNLTSQDTQNTANANFNRLVLNAANDYMFVDDFYILDTTGSAPTNDFLGDVRVECLYPNGNGNTSNLVGQDADSTNNYLNVDEIVPNDDTDYNESSTVGDKDTYAFGNLTSTTGSVFGVQISPYSKKTDAGARSICSIARLSTTEVDSSNKTLSASYIYQPDLREAKPGGGAWTISDVNSAEFGIKVTA